MNGTPSTSTPTARMIVPSPMPMSTAGTVLPIRISIGCNGDTNNCSKVPSSRSRAIDSAVTINPISAVSTATIAGTVFHNVSKFGLNQARLTNAVPGGGARACCARSALNC